MKGETQNKERKKERSKEKKVRASTAEDSCLMIAQFYWQGGVDAGVPAVSWKYKKKMMMVTVTVVAKTKEQARVKQESARAPSCGAQHQAGPKK